VVIEYEIGDGRLPAGSTLGSPRAIAVLKATGALAKLYSCEAGADAFGAVVVGHRDRRSRVELQPRLGRFVIAPEGQERFVEYPAGLSSHERVFVLNARPTGAAPRTAGPPGAFYEVSVRNGGDETAEIETVATICMAARPDESITASYEDDLRAFVARDEKGRLVRIAATTIPAAGHEIVDGRIASFRFEHVLEPGDCAGLTLILTFSIDGEKSARRNLTSLPNSDDALTGTQTYYRSAFDRAVVATPEAEVNRGMLWAKANMLRSLLLTPQGWCIVNDPAETTHCVARDTAWFALGADYIVPWFAAESLRWFFDHLTEKGMAVEWYDTRTGTPETYGLELNDNTPLLIWSAWHHFCVTGDADFLRSIYGNVLRAGRYILSRRGAHGLVWCCAPGVGSRGIVGWRNALHDRRLSGATTELNCECYAALKAVSSIATELGDSGTAAAFAQHADELSAAINGQLLDRSRSLYYLALGEDGKRCDDVTADLVFPILFGVAAPEIAENIIETLTGPDFWSAAGLRTVPRNAIDYTPDANSGLLGGVWAGPTLWFATAAVPFDAEIVADVLAATFRHCAEDPLRYNTVPGQFCEWLHGETLTNHGMMLSPWLAPKYLWSAIEGAAGLEVTACPPRLHRRLPPAWDWLAARNMSIRGNEASWFAVRMERVFTYVAAPQQVVDADFHYDEDVSAEVSMHGEAAVCVALSRANSLVVFVGNTSERGIATTVAVAASRLPSRAVVRLYDSVAGRWSNRSRGLVEETWAVHPGGQGFCILEFTWEI
jgi:hypothetical protein